MLKIDPWNILFIAINLIVLYIIMRLVFIKPIKNILDKRDAIIRDGLEDAAQKERKARALKAQWQDKLDSSKNESAEIITKAKEDAKAEYDKIIAQANAEAAQIIEKAHKEIEKERTKAVSELQSEIGMLAIDITKKVLGESDMKGINNSLYEKFLTEGDLSGTDVN